MIQRDGVVLKPGKEKAIRQRHHWIFSGAIETLPSCKEGEILPVYTANGELLGRGYFNRRSGITGRMLTFDDVPVLEGLEQRLEDALAWREQCIDKQQTNAYRLINAEGDGIPGLIIDCYDRVIVLQISTKGMERLKPWLVEYLNRRLMPQTIYEKSLMSARREEGLKDFEGYLSGEKVSHMTFRENGHVFTASLSQSQKTGFFLDHREMRQWMGQLSQGKRVLNAFAYTGGFSVYALAGGAQLVDSVDSSAEALEAAQQNVQANGFDPSAQGFFCEDVFNFLRQREELPYELVILDPPAFAKKQKDIIQACRGYKDINRLALQKMPTHSLLLTCSCSHYVDEELFQKVLFQAALEAGREVCLVGRHRLAPDHPLNLFHPETQYLKSCLLFIKN